MSVRVWPTRLGSDFVSVCPDLALRAATCTQSNTVVSVLLLAVLVSVVQHYRFLLLLGVLLSALVSVCEGLAVLAESLVWLPFPAALLCPAPLPGSCARDGRGRGAKAATLHT